MRVMVFVKANSESETGQMPSTEMLEEMGRFNEELVNAGVMLAGEGLHPTSNGKRVRFEGKKRSVVDGPFQSNDLVAGFWIWRVKSMDEAVEWAKRCPNPTGEMGELEIRPIFETEDFGAELTPELREQEERLRARVEGR
jgi:hypothetical protein